MFHYKPSILGYPIYGNPPYVWGWSHEASCKEMHCLFRHVLLASFSVQVCSSLRNDLEEFFVGTRWNYCIYKDINICFLTWQHALIVFSRKRKPTTSSCFSMMFFSYCCGWDHPAVHRKQSPERVSGDLEKWRHETITAWWFGTWIWFFHLLGMS